ncbi:MAG: hypothetical protein QG602_2121 [Verrucomicrobiota bacterium]|nr:hypothetical protein [Verrucomicrobiota bacterium]
MVAASMFGFAGIAGADMPTRRTHIRKGEKYPGQRSRYLIGANTSERLAVMPYIPEKK